MKLAVWIHVLLSVSALAVPAQDSPPPVLLINGFDLNAAITGSCEPEPDSTGTFGRLQELLEADGRTVIFFDNCRFGVESIETLGRALGGVIEDIGRPVDLIGFSLGGLIVRSYLAGKVPDEDDGFDPPADPLVRKAVLVATPSFGSPLASLVPTGIQGPQMREGSRFTWELARWHQGTDDLREIDALAVAGDGGHGQRGDGVVPIVSASLTSMGFSPERTRVIPACHNRIAFLLCGSNETMIEVDDESHPTGRIIRSFLADTDDWRTVGAAVSDHPSPETGLYFAAAGSTGDLDPNATAPIATRVDAAVSDTTLDSGDPGIFFSRSLATGEYSVGLAAPVRLTPGQTQTVLAKEGPLVARIIPSAALIPTCSTRCFRARTTLSPWVSYSSPAMPDPMNQPIPTVALM